jgi:anaerobic glycerol-3-phosphate dehydrogenase
MTIQVTAIGGGIGGLSAGLAMLKARRRLCLPGYSEMGEISASLQITPNASIVASVALKDAMDARGRPAGRCEPR